MNVLKRWFLSLGLLLVLSFFGAIGVQAGLESIDIYKDYWSCFGVFFWLSLVSNLIYIYIKIDDAITGMYE